MTHVPRGGGHDGGGSPLMMILFGIVIGCLGGLYLMSLIHMTPPFLIPEVYLQYGSALGALLGGLYIVYKTVFRHRIILY